MGETEGGASAGLLSALRNIAATVLAIIVETLARALGLDTSGDPRLADPALKPARVRGLEADTLAPLPEGVTTLGLLDREDRV